MFIIPQRFSEQVELGSITIRSKPFEDKEVSYQIIIILLLFLISFDYTNVFFPTSAKWRYVKKLIAVIL